MRIRVFPLVLLAAAALAGCGRDSAQPAPAGAPTPAAATPAAAADDGVESDAQKEADAIAAQFPAIPVIVVPEIVGVTPAQRALESAMAPVLDPIAGVKVTPARCGAGGALLHDAGLTSVDAQGQLSRIGDEGIFKVAADGSGTANYEGGLITVNADGSGSINGDGGDEDGEGGALVRVEADGSGSYNGPAGIITLDGKGAGTWNGDSGLIRNNGDGSGTWNGPLGLVTINNDGSGRWNGPLGLVTVDGDGRGRIGAPAREVTLPALAKVAPAGRFPSLKKFAPPGAPCGYLITLSDRVLFDFDKSDIRADAAKVLDTLAAALKDVRASGMEIGGHTDAKGSDDYNLALSQRRAQAVAAALSERGAAQQAAAKGYGESQPVAPNEIGGQDHPGGRQLNRRVEIFVRT
ncbi:OmpA family protein [Lysobacter sp. K5869]|uniref:OmpA family protein n=1 Tax=Lysobacter sp. K5869 TaxID=2820808 RepID=UPI001C05FA45|nr:OmpA family protein [Lysobacter sp. K5869]QWP75427.1 OmpA family protein [Lysobacter sp. K5869]